MAKEETRWEWEYDVGKERAKELSRQKGFKNAKAITAEISYKKNPVREEHEPFIQYDKPNEAV